MIIFRNPGLIDLDAVRTMGVSVKNPGSFGYFGTGLKFALATILRNGGSVTIYRGTEAHPVTAEPKEIRGETFHIVCLDGEAMGITTQLGRNWEPWMVLRELGCNATDEGGTFGPLDEGFDPAVHTAVLAEGDTVIVVGWADLDNAYKQRGDLFIEGEPLFENEAVRILPGPSAHLFYRGVRVKTLDKPALFKYDLLTAQTLTEDRVLASTYSADQIIRDAMLAMDDATIIRPVISASDHYHEAKLDFEAWGVKPSKAFIDATVEAREAQDKINPSARKLLMKRMRETAGEEAYSGGGSYRRAIEDSFGYALHALESVGVKFDDDQKFIVIEELPGTAKTMIENGRIYMLADFTKLPAREVALDLIARWVDLQGIYSADQATAIFGPLLLQTTRLKIDETLVAEDAAAAAGITEPELSAEAIAAAEAGPEVTPPALG